VLIDLHCHTAGLSACSSLQPEELVDIARERGIDALCLTEHDRWWDSAELAALAKRTAFPVFAGVELTLAGGHYLGYGLEPGEATTTVAGAASLAGSGLLYLAHPARSSQLRLTDEMLRLCASVEAINGSDSRLTNASGGALAGKFALPGIGGSDCHTPAEVGAAATLFRQSVTTMAELVRELRAGRYEPLYL
jgi:hypothetical protein